MQSHDTMRDTVCVVTGGNSGIGLESVRALAARGATVALVARDGGKGESAARAIRARQAGARVDVLVADLASLAQVRRLAAEITQRYPALHVLINNAGLMLDRRRLTSDGFEMTFAVNYLAPFLLTNLLLGRLIASAPARIINVASVAHVRGRLRWEDYDGAWRTSGWRAYNDSKLALVMFTRELARRLAGTGVVANALHPGVIASNLAQEPGNISGLFFRLFRPFLTSPEHGAQTTVYLAMAPEAASVSGEYFANRRPRRAAASAYDDAACRRLWDVSAQLVGLGATASSARGQAPA